MPSVSPPFFVVGGVVSLPDGCGEALQFFRPFSVMIQLFRSGWIHREEGGGVRHLLEAGGEGKPPFFEGTQNVVYHGNVETSLCCFQGLYTTEG